MAEDVVIRYRAEVDELVKKLKQVEAEQEKIINNEEEQGDAAKKAANSQQLAAQKRLKLLKEEEKALAILKRQRELAFNPKDIEKFNTAIANSEKKIKLLGGAAQKEVGGLGGLFKNFALGAAAGIAAAFSTQAILSFGKAAIDAFAKLETSRLIFNNLVGDAQVAKELFDELTEFSVATPFTPEQIQDGSRALLQFGVAVDDVVPTIKILGDISAGTGKDLRELAIIFGQIKSTGRLMGQDLLQLINAGFNPLQVISEKTGKSMSVLKKEVEKGAISFEMVEDAFKAATSEGGKFFNLTQQLSTTTAGQLSTIEGEAEALAAAIGERLAPSFLKAKKTALEFATQLVNAALNMDEFFIKLFKYVGLNPSEEVNEVGNSFDELGKSIRKQLKSAEDLAAFDELANKLRSDQSKSINDQVKGVERLQNALDAAKNKEVKNIKEISALQQAIDKLNKTNVQNEITKLNIIEDIIEKERVIKEKALENEIELTEEQRKAAQKLVDEIKKQQEELRKLQVANISDERIRREAQFEDEIKAITATGELRNKIIKELQIKLNRDLAALDKKEKDDERAAANKFDEGQFKETKSTQDTAKKAAEIKLNNEIEALLLASRTERLAKAKQEQIRIEGETRNEIALLQRKFDNGEIKSKQELEDLKVIATQEGADKIKAINSKLSIDFEELAKSDAEIWFETNAQIIQTSQQLLGELTSLYAAFANAQIDEIHRVRDERIKAIDKQLEANEEALEKRRISEKQATDNEKQLIEEKLRAEEAAANQERKIKREQAILDKAAALINITIATAVNIAEAGNPILAALYAALGAAQAAVVVAQPIPYKKGTKSAKGGLSLVGEEGPELMMADRGAKILPAGKTKQNADLIDAMFDNRLDKFILDRYINPALVSQKKQHEKQAGETFASNISKSMIFNQLGLTPNDLEANRRKGQRIANVDELAEAIAGKIKPDPYRR